MTHLTDDQIYDLVEKVATEGAFTLENIQSMKHIATCEECYQLFCCLKAVYDASEQLGDMITVPATVQVPVRQTVSAIIRLVADQVKPILSQFDPGASAWRFGTPLLLAGTRSGRQSGSAAKKLVDTHNSRTFISYNPAEKLLILQIDCSREETAPRAFLRHSDGTRREIPLEKHEELLTATVSGLDMGEYEIILEK